MFEIGLVPTHEGAGRYALQGVGTLRVEGAWDGATAKTDVATWRFESSGWSLRKSATATDAAGSLIANYHGQVLRWDDRELRLRQQGWRSLGWRAFITDNPHFVVADGERMLVVLDCKFERSHRPVNIEADVAPALEPGLLLLLAFLGGWFASREHANDGL